MARGFSVVSGSTQVHKLLEDGTVQLGGSVSVTGSLVPDADDTRTFGDVTNRWSDVYAVQTTVGAIFESGLTTKGISRYPTGTILAWGNGELSPCTSAEDVKVIGVVKNGKDQPIVMGAEPVLVHGPVKSGDFIVTSEKPGYGKRAKTKNWLFIERKLTGKIIAQALEDCSEENGCLIKCWIQKM